MAAKKLEKIVRKEGFLYSVNEQKLQEKVSTSFFSDNTEYVTELFSALYNTNPKEIKVRFSKNKMTMKSDGKGFSGPEIDELLSTIIGVPEDNEFYQRFRPLALGVSTAIESGADEVHIESVKNNKSIHYVAKVVDAKSLSRQEQRNKLKFGNRVVNFSSDDKVSITEGTTITVNKKFRKQREKLFSKARSREYYYLTSRAQKSIIPFTVNGTNHGARKKSYLEFDRTIQTDSYRAKLFFNTERGPQFVATRAGVRFENDFANYDAFSKIHRLSLIIDTPLGHVGMAGRRKLQENIYQHLAAQDLALELNKSILDISDEYMRSLNKKVPSESLVRKENALRNILQSYITVPEEEWLQMKMTTKRIFQDYDESLTNRMDKWAESFKESRARAIKKIESLPLFESVTGSFVSYEEIGENQLVLTTTKKRQFDEFDGKIVLKKNGFLDRMGTGVQFKDLDEYILDLEKSRKKYLQEQRLNERKRKKDLTSKKRYQKRMEFNSKFDLVRDFYRQFFGERTANASITIDKVVSGIGMTVATPLLVGLGLVGGALFLPAYAGYKLVKASGKVASYSLDKMNMLYEKTLPVRAKTISGLQYAGRKIGQGTMMTLNGIAKAGNYAFRGVVGGSVGLYRLGRWPVVKTYEFSSKMASHMRNKMEQISEDRKIKNDADRYEKYKDLIPVEERGHYESWGLSKESLKNLKKKNKEWKAAEKKYREEERKQKKKNERLSLLSKNLQKYESTVDTLRESAQVIYDAFHSEENETFRRMLYGNLYSKKYQWVEDIADINLAGIVHYRRSDDDNNMIISRRLFPPKRFIAFHEPDRAESMPFYNAEYTKYEQFRTANRDLPAIQLDAVTTINNIQTEAKKYESERGLIINLPFFKEVVDRLPLIRTTSLQSPSRTISYFDPNGQRWASYQESVGYLNDRPYEDIVIRYYERFFDKIKDRNVERVMSFYSANRVSDFKNSLSALDEKELETFVSRLLQEKGTNETLNAHLEHTYPSIVQKVAGSDAYQPPADQTT
ncbi:MAG: hypothetical protein KC535_00485 [Nanoarchaeota archaeon]|nr:hypothetical protein [Nanoarchaeota archaeon]